MKRASEHPELIKCCRAPLGFRTTLPEAALNESAPDDRVNMGCCESPKAVGHAPGGTEQGFEAVWGELAV